MSNEAVESAYISCACNVSPHSVDWGKNNLIVYGTCNAIAFYNVDKNSDAGQVESTLCTNRSKINVVHWLRTVDCLHETEGLSGSSDGMLVLWNLVSKKCTYLEGHQMGVTVVDSLYLPENAENMETARTFIASASADSTVKLWSRSEEEGSFTCIQTLNFGHGICLAIRLYLLPGKQSLVLACAMDNSKIQLYAADCSTADVEFARVDTLAGHEDWVRALDFTEDDSGDILLASGSQDSTVRLWRISACSARRARKPLSLLGPTEEIEAEERIFTVGLEQNFAVTLESVLAAHEGWVYGVAWHPPVYEDGVKTRQPMSLLTCSMDKTMIVWCPDQESDIWYEQVRVGDLGGNSLGFYGCKFSPDGLGIMGHGYQGAFNMWRCSQTSGSWEPQVACGGHFKEVVDVQWEPRGDYLLSVGLDQTTRLHAPWVSDQRVTWHELARPQVHGFDMSCLACISRHRFSSGSEEKLVRCFEAPRSFLSSLARVTRCADDGGGVTAQGATVPSLGLSNKAVYEVSEKKVAGKREFQEAGFTAVDSDKPPTEDNLLQNTLWPEARKLYGHGYEVYALAARRDGKLLASVCKASTPEHAAIILWDTTTWQELQRLTSHKLTVTQMSFSPDDNFLLSVSRDRCWSLFERDSADAYRLAARSDPKTGIHSRIIWCCAWSHDSRHFATGSRDGKVVVWRLGEKDTSRRCDAVLTMTPIGNDSVTAVSFAPDMIDQDVYLLSVGFESGIIKGYKWGGSLTEAVECFEIDSSCGHHLRVQRLSFRPVFGLAGCASDEKTKSFVQLASCGADHAVKIFNLDCRQL